MSNVLKFRLTTFLGLTSKKICSSNHPSPSQIFLKTEISNFYLSKISCLAFRSKVQLFLLPLNLQNTNLADAIESIAKKNIVSVLGMAESVQKCVFVSIVIINPSLLVSKLTYSSSGRYLICSITSERKNDHIRF